MAYATVAGLPPVAGLWAALPALVIYALLGSSPLPVDGPGGHDRADDGHRDRARWRQAIRHRYAALAAVLALLVGLMSLGAWLLRLGFVADLLSRPVLVGYMAGVGLIMIADQLRRVTGVPVTGQAFFAQLDLVCPRHRPHRSRRRSPLAAAVLAFLLLLQWRWPHAPGPLLAMLLATAAVAAFGLRSHGVRRCRADPGGCCRSPGCPTFIPRDLRELLLPAFTVLIVAFSDDVLTARSFARRGEEIRPNRELLALCAANVGASLLRGFPVSSSATRTAIGMRSGQPDPAVLAGRSRSALAVLLFLRPVLSRFPAAALGAIVIYAAIRLIDLRRVPAAARLPPRRIR